ncbi:uncharacterized protein Dvir_GJ26087 [Drosophila virilis]|uniref:Uncharacterized protein n=1 Tax=Drosophila virilis TaxID=7244 RepID=A0A0Q9W6F5_DROVI|nr:uncharacterized protein Dvir_GJ26087 [Drosophila virilis]
MYSYGVTSRKDIIRLGWRNSTFMGPRNCEIVVPPIDMSYVDETDQKTNHLTLDKIKSPKIVSKAKKSHKLEVNEKVVKKAKKKSRKLTTELPQVGLVKVPPRVLATQSAELDLNGPANTRQIADYLLENRLTVNNGSLQLAAPKEKPNGECHCADRLGLLARLITSRHDPIYTARISPSLKHLSDIMQELLSILSLFFVVGLLLACYLCSKPRELSFLQHCYETIQIVATDSCYDCGLC